jgi:type I restriction enzyme S subunit
MKETEMPTLWSRATLDELTFKLVDGSHNPPKKQNTGLPMLSAVNIYNNKIEFSQYRLITESEFAEEHRRTRIQTGDVLLTIVGAIGRTAIVPSDCRPFTLQRSVAVLTPALIEPKFLMYQLESPRIVQFFTRNARGTAQKGIYLGTLGTTEIWFPSLLEQQRIIEKIEALLSLLDDGIQSLTTARDQLNVYRQALLKCAFEGKLTAHLRKENKHKVEASDRLLAQIRSERDAHSTRSRKRRASKESSDFLSDEREHLPQLPFGWVWAKLGYLFDVVSGATPKGIEQVRGADIPYYKVSDMNTPGNETKMDVATLNLSETERDDLGLTSYPEDTVIFPKRGGAILTNKKRILSRPSCFDLNTMGVVNALSSISSDYLWYWFQKLDLSRIYDGSNVPQINNKNVDPLPFPVCAIAEQHEIVRLLEEKLSVVDQMERDIGLEIHKADALRLSILKKAFSGKLVSQYPDDEPASVLLERIKAEKAEKENSKKKNGRRKAA